MKPRTLKFVSAIAPVAAILGVASSGSAQRANHSIAVSRGSVSTPPHLGGIYPRLAPDVLPTGCASPSLQYGGGQVIASVEVVQVNWGPSVNPATITFFETWYPAMVGGPYITWLKEYNANSQAIGGGTYRKNPSSTGSWTIAPTNAATTVSETDIGTEIIAQINAKNLPAPTKDAAGNSNTIYMIDFPNSMTETLQGNASCQTFCGYHETATDPSLGKIYYGVHPDMGTGSGCEPSGGSWRCGGSIDPLVATAVVHGHELVEAVTDPENDSAWVDSNAGCGEIGDICANELGACGNATCVSASVGSVSLGGTLYYAQTEWSNAQNDCVMHGPQVPCTTSADCAATPSTPICDATSKVCRACGSGDCTGAKPACETMGSLTGQCVQCTAATSVGCTGVTPICNTALDTCRACTASDCKAPKAVCETSGSKSGDCVQCDPTSKTACTGATPICDAATFTCVGCASSSDCLAPTPICDTTSMTCRGCTGSGDCSSGQVCATSGSRAGSCVSCTKNSDCTSPTAPTCNVMAGTCGPCAGPSDCSSGTCNATTGACAAPAGSDGGGADGGADGGAIALDGSAGSAGDGGGLGDTGGSSGGCGCVVASGGGGERLASWLAGALLGLVVFARRRTARR